MLIAVIMVPGQGGPAFQCGEALPLHTMLFSMQYESGFCNLLVMETGLVVSGSEMMQRESFFDSSSNVRYTVFEMVDQSATDEHQGDCSSVVLSDSSGFGLESVELTTMEPDRNPIQQAAFCWVGGTGNICRGSVILVGLPSQSPYLRYISSKAGLIWLLFPKMRMYMRYTGSGFRKRLTHVVSRAFPGRKL